jgi:hypothetical protein
MLARGDASQESRPPARGSEARTGPCRVRAVDNVPPGDACRNGPLVCGRLVPWYQDRAAPGQYGRPLWRLRGARADRPCEDSDVASAPAGMPATSRWCTA